MTDMQRFNVNWNGSLRQYEQVLDPRGPYVWASDAEAAIAVLIDDQVKEIAEYVTAIAAAEQQAEYREQSGAAWYHGHEQGQRDMLAKCIEVVEALRACEQRARQDERTRMSPEWVYQQGYDNGLYDARIAVMKLCEKQPSTWPTSEAAMDELTDTINALKEQP